MATVLRAKTAGFCMGVGLALRKLDQALKEHRARSSGRLVMLGPIIHNPQVMNTYMQQGVVLAEDQGVIEVFQNLPSGFLNLIAGEDHIDARLDGILDLQGQNTRVPVQVLCLSLEPIKSVCILQV